MKNFSAFEKIAILFRCLGEDVSAEILKKLDKKDAQKVILTLQKHQNIKEFEIDEVVAEFADLLQAAPQKAVSGDQRIVHNILEKAFGMEKAKDFFHSTDSQSGLIRDLLREIDDELLLNFLVKEPVIVVASVMCFLDPARRVSCFAELEAAFRLEVLIQMATLKPLSVEALTELEGHLRELSENSKLIRSMRVGGPAVAAQLLNRLESSIAQKLLADIEKRDPDLAERIHKEMFRFDDLTRIPERDFQKLLMRVDRVKLALALRKASSEIETYIFANLSQRAAEDLRALIAQMKPQKISEVESARRDIVQLAREMQEKGEIEIRSPTDVYV